MNKERKETTTLFLFVTLEDEEGEKTRIKMVQDMPLKTLVVLDDLIDLCETHRIDSAVLVDLLNPANDFRDALKDDEEAYNKRFKPGNDDFTMTFQEFVFIREFLTDDFFTQTFLVPGSRSLQFHHDVYYSEFNELKVNSSAVRALHGYYHE